MLSFPQLMSTTDLQNYLASDEELLLSFSAENIEDSTDDSVSQDTTYKFGATDRRIVYITSSGGFKDIEYTHISSIESENQTDNTEEGGAICIGCCGGVFLIAALGAIGESPASGILGVLIGGAVVVGAYYAYQNAEQTEKQKIKFITGDEADSKIEATVSTDESTNIAAELSRILREQR